MPSFLVKMLEESPQAVRDLAVELQHEPRELALMVGLLNMLPSGAPTPAEIERIRTEVPVLVEDLGFVYDPSLVKGLLKIVFKYGPAGPPDLWTFLGED
jgi:hypothetical protein